MASDDTRTYSLETLRAMRARGETETRADAPLYEVDADFWATARVVRPSPEKVSVSLQLDADVLKWFEKQGRDPAARMSAVLRSFMEAEQNRR
jgi:uncharacterized protein (DUF4415 family)